MSIETIYCIGYASILAALTIADYLYSRRMTQ